MLAPLEAIRTKFLPALIGREVSDHERTLFAFPCRLAGLGILDPPTNAQSAIRHSRALTKCLVDKILEQAIDLDPQALRSEQQKRATRLMLEGALSAYTSQDTLPENLMIAAKLAKEPVADRTSTLSSRNRIKQTR